MSIYKFQDSETVITATSTTVITGADSLLMYSATDARTRQSTVNSVATAWTVTNATTTSTATGIINSGITLIGSTVFGSLARHGDILPQGNHPKKNRPA